MNVINGLKSLKIFCHKVSFIQHLNTSVVVYLKLDLKSIFLVLLWHVIPYIVVIHANVIGCQLFDANAKYFDIWRLKCRDPCLFFTCWEQCGQN